MSLDTALLRTVSSINLDQKAMEIASENISRAHEEGYARKDIFQSSDKRGSPKVSRIKHVVDNWLLQEKRERNSNISYLSCKTDYLDRMQRLFGVPDIIGSGGIAHNLTSGIENFFALLNRLSASPENESLKSSVVLESDNLCNMISGIANRLQEMRKEADDKVSNTISRINYIIHEIDQLNKAKHKANQAEYKEGINLRTSQYLSELSGYLEISVTENKHGDICVASSGYQLLDGSNMYNLDYQPAISLDQISSEKGFSAIKILKLDSRGNIANEKEKILVPAGNSTNSASSLGLGKLKSLIEIRDKDCKEILEELDLLSDTMAKEFNEIYAAGSNFPGMRKVHGATKFRYNDEIKFKGNIRVAVLDDWGTPLNIKGMGYVKPLKVDLKDIGDAEHPVTFKEFIDELNNFFSVGGTRVKLNADIDNLRIATVKHEDTFFKFKFESDSNNIRDVDISINNFKLMERDKLGNFTEISSSTISPADNYIYTNKSGSVSRTDKDFSVDLSGVSSDYFTIRAEVEIAGEVHVIDYDIEKAGVTSKRHDAIRIVDSDVAELVYSGFSNNQLIKASMVDDNGNVIPYNKSNAQSSYGYLEINSKDNKFRIALDAMDSKEEIFDYNDEVMRRNFFHATKINTFFSEKDSILNSAKDLSISRALKEDHSLMNTGILNVSQGLEQDRVGKFTYEIGQGNNYTVLKLANLIHSRVKFDKVGSIPAVYATFSEYSTHIISNCASKANYYHDNYEREELLKSHLDSRFDAVSGVNINEELAKTTMLEEHFAASSRVVSVMSDLYKTILDSF